MTDKPSWQEKLDALSSEQEQQLLQRLRQEDPDLADALWATTVENNLDAIGLEKAPAGLQQKLYGISDSKKAPVKKPLQLWTAWAGVAAVLVIAVMIKPWQSAEPSAQEIAEARQQLAVTFYYLDKAAAIARQETEASLAFGVKTAMDSSPFVEIEAEEDDIEL